MRSAAAASCATAKALAIGKPPGAKVGHWAKAYLSPDGKTFLAQWSAECEVPTRVLRAGSRRRAARRHRRGGLGEGAAVGRGRLDARTDARSSRSGAATAGCRRTATCTSSRRTARARRSVRFARKARERSDRWRRSSKASRSTAAPRTSSRISTTSAGTANGTTMILETRIETEGPTRVGTRATDKRKLPMGKQDVSYEITEHEPPRRSAFRGTNGAVRPVGSVTIEPLDGGARSRADARVRVAGPRLRQAARAAREPRSAEAHPGAAGEAQGAARERPT